MKIRGLSSLTDPQAPSAPKHDAPGSCRLHFILTPSYIDWQGHRLSGAVAYPALMASSGVSLSFNPAYFHERRFSLLSISGP